MVQSNYQPPHISHDARIRNGRLPEKPNPAEANYDLVRRIMLHDLVIEFPPIQDSSAFPLSIYYSQKPHTSELLVIVESSDHRTVKSSEHLPLVKANLLARDINSYYQSKECEIELTRKVVYEKH